MFIFPFSVDLTQEDLVNFWQNLPPDPARNATVSEPKYVSHSLNLDDLDLSGDVYWQIFKVKQRAKTSYSDKLAETFLDLDIGSDLNTSEIGISLKSEVKDSLGTVDAFIKSKGVSYNWPYDFFSLIELVKVEAKVDFENSQGVAPAEEHVAATAGDEAARRLLRQD